MIVTAFSFLPLAIWACLLLGRGGFWRCRERDDTVDTHHVGDGPWPSIAAVVPARDEASVIGLALDRLSIEFGLRILAIVPGRVSTEVDARLSFDTETGDAIRDEIAVLGELIHAFEVNSVRERP